MQKCETYRRVLQLIEEVLPVFSASKLPQSQSTHNWYQHKANAEVLQSSVPDDHSSVTQDS